MPTSVGSSRAPRRRARAGRVARKAPLTRDRVTAAALEMADRGELETLTMRKLAAELGVTAMALYAHVASKDEILDEIIDRVLEREGLPPTDGAEWKAWTIAAAERLRAVLTRFPSLLDRYCRRPVGVPAALRRMEAALEVLERAGFDDESTIAAYATIHTYTLGFTALEIAREISSRGSTESRTAGALTEASPHYWPAFFAALAPAEYPTLRRLTPDLADFTSDAHFREGLLTVLEGLHRSLR